MSLGLLTVAGTISQTIYFDSPSSATDQFHINLSINDSSLLNLGVDDGVTVEALLGDDVVFTQSDFSLLNLDLLNLLSNGQAATLTFEPGVSFDRVRIRLSSLIQLNLTKKLSISSVYRSPNKPHNAEALDTLICYNQTAELSAGTSSENELRWYEQAIGGTPVAITDYNETYTTPLLTMTTTYYVAAAVIGCNYESDRVPIVIDVAPQYHGYPNITIENTTN